MLFRSHRATDDRCPNSPARWGLRRALYGGEPIKTPADEVAILGPDGLSSAQRRDDVAHEFFVLAESFRRELCKGIDHRTAAQVLFERGHLERGQDGRHSLSMRLPGIGQARVYHVKPSVFGDAWLAQ